jgi:hypothetical protein
MSDTHLGANAQNVFKPGEWSEVFRTVYNVLDRAVRDRADTIRLDETAIRWFRHDQELGMFPLTIVTPTRSHRSVLESIIARDTLVQQYVMIRHLSPDEIVCQITSRST